MTYEVPPEAVGRHKSVTIWGSGDQFDHRGMVLRGVCELEYQCGQVLFAYFSTKNKALTWEATEEDLFGEIGLLSALARRVKIAVYLGLLSNEEASDLRLLGKLRNMYAHGRTRSQFNEDAKAAAVVRSLALVKNSPQQTVGYDEQGLFLLCCEVLESRLKCIREKIMQEKSAA